MRLTFLALLLGLAACGEEGPTTATPAAAPSAAAEVLESVSRAFAQARDRGDTAALVAMTKAMLPTPEDLRKVLRSGPAAEAFLAKYDAAGIRAHADVASREILKPSSPAQTVVRVHTATTEELGEYRKGTTAFAEFPGGMKRFAQTTAAPGREWMKIEYLEAGKDDGMSFSCFTVLDEKVIFLIKPWRAIPRDEEAEDASDADRMPPGR